jgi:hypothetical protein
VWYLRFWEQYLRTLLSSGIWRPEICLPMFRRNVQLNWTRKMWYWFRKTDGLGCAVPHFSTVCLTFYPEDSKSMFLWNVCRHLRLYNWHLVNCGSHHKLSWQILLWPCTECLSWQILLWPCSECPSWQNLLWPCSECPSW